MSDYGRYGETGYAGRGRERDYEEGWWRDDDDRLSGRRDRESLFGGRGRWSDDDRGPDDQGRRSRRDESGFFGRDRDRDVGRDRYGRGTRAGRHSHRERGLDRDRDSDQDRSFARDRSRDGDRYGYDDRHEGLPIDETTRLIASNKVEGTPVYGRDGDRLGTIYNFMVDKYSGQVEYAVMGYGGFLGMGQRYYPLPWRILDYDTREGGYRISMSHRDLERAPSFTRDDEPQFSRDYGLRVNDWYGL